MLSVSVTPPSLYPEVLSLLLSHLDESERLLQTKELLEAARRSELDLSGLVMARKDAEVCGAILSINQPDDTAFVWPPVSKDIPESNEIEDQLLQFLGDQMEVQDIWMGQCIVDIGASRERQALERNQFEHAANLIYMGRELEDPIPELDPEKSLESVTYSEDENHEVFKEILGQTYIETFDCTILNDCRTLDETLRSHRLSGEFLPSQWKVFYWENKPVGILLMNDHSDQNAWEVVYTGVIPEVRGKGFGREIVLSGLYQAEQANRDRVILAVDGKNPYAHSVYESLGFMEIIRKSVHIRLVRK